MKEKTSIQVTHNIEVAHRLFLTPGKCENIHGHSMLVELEMWGDINAQGLMEGLEFGQVKRIFRKHLDDTYDHQLLLNKDDPWAVAQLLDGQVLYLPGLAVCPYGDPTTENLARWIGAWGQGFKDIKHIKCTVHETKVNMATWEWEL